MTSAGPSTPSASSSTAVEEVRPQAGPLPLKRGEIGYRADLHEEEAQEIRNPEPVLPERHPADRENTSNSASSAPSSNTPPPTSTSPTPSTINKLLKKPKKICYGGVTLSTLLGFLIQLLMVFGTTAGWVVTTVLMDKKKKESKEGNVDTQGTIPSTVFIHVVFAIAVLGQLLFLERRLYRLRAERYAYLHPGEIIPSSIRYGPGTDPTVAFALWNRPPLPTYAAALAQSGVGTGDVEDHIIAQPPPPVYGNTRGSTLLLSGYLRNSLRAQRPASSAPTTPGSERPVSYHSSDSEWETVQDVRRAQQLEHTLATLERNR